METILDIAKQADEKVLFVGEHGIGKTDIVKQWAEKNNYHCEVIMLSQIEVGDLIGIPYNNNGVTEWSTPLWLQRIYEAKEEGKNSVLFLDELNRGTIDTRQAALQLVHEKKIFTHELPKETFIISAINPEDDYQVDELDKALKDRFLIVEVKPNAKKWLEWAEKNNVHRSITMFIKKKPEYIHTNESDDDVTPTPRSWTKLSDLIRAYEESQINNENVFFQLCKGKVGKIIGSEFFNFYKEMSSYVSVEDVVEALDNFKKRDFERDKNIVKNLIKDADENIIMTLLQALAELDDYYYFTITIESVGLEQAAAFYSAIKEKRIDTYLSIAKKNKEEYLQYHKNAKGWVITRCNIARAS